MKLFQVIKDGLTIISSSDSVKNKYEFAWLVHSRSVEDFRRKFSLAKVLPEKIVKYICQTLRPIIVSEITGVIDKNGRKTDGCIIGIPLLPEQITADPVFAKKRIIQALKLAKRNGAKIVALGALNSAVTQGGFLVKDISSVSLTNSYALLSILGVEKVKEIIKQKNKNFGISFAVFGATTILGRIFTKLLISEGANKLLFVGKTIENLDSLKKSCLSLEVNPGLEIITTTDAARIKNYDFVAITTNSADASIRPDYLKEGAIVVDITQPPNPSTKILKAQEDISVFDEVTIETPGINYHFNFGLPKERAYACLAEVILLAMENRWDNFGVGEITIEQAKEIKFLFDKHNFKLISNI